MIIKINIGKNTYLHIVTFISICGDILTNFVKGIFEGWIRRVVVNEIAHVSCKHKNMYLKTDIAAYEPDYHLEYLSFDM